MKWSSTCNEDRTKRGQKKKERKNRKIRVNDVFAGAAQMYLLMVVF